MRRVQGGVGHRLGMIVIDLSVAILFSRGGCVLNSEVNVLLPNMGLTMQRAEVEGEMEVVGIWLL